MVANPNQVAVSPLATRVRIARQFHEEYEHMAPAYGWETQEASRADWDDLPSNQRRLMVHVIGNLQAAGVISEGPNA